ncbi:circularly permuted type 2 ATP-grasp protein [Litorivicinus lipolyticus]|uniref:Circularly permuted type 2 ATP-grasp protein n=1 Tax=Litorivicinus lipolyticus TaxID=418701 RepID=A0A5Q2QBK2_9GAMM|nr:circularly permuted type 2 ATP-grasp protein [Litorivicinus lipolyticus]QGG79652.1 circularly permuted type 2 ATP-grasp protein [Litorivicinus lipolyticus]
MACLFDEYPAQAGFFDELLDQGAPRPVARALCEQLNQLTHADLSERQAALDAEIRAQGISFTVYSDSQNIDRAWPLDLIPRVIGAREWRCTSAGLQQRLQALNLFIDDLYNDQRVLKDGIIPSALLLDSPNFRPECIGTKPAHGVWAHVCGSDLVRDGEGTIRVLEDNLRVPSGVSYMLENRNLIKRVLPELFKSQNVLPVQDYATSLLDTLTSLSPRTDVQPTVAVLTPGIYNSAYFEHCYLAQQMGAQLVEGADLVCQDNIVYMRTIFGLQRVDVIYRRIDDTFLDPDVFNPDSALGVRGLMAAWRAGNVAIANAPGAGVADDKAVYAYVPALIKYYLDQDPIIENVPTFLCSRPNECQHVLANLDKLVVKPVNESGGYGLLIGPHASQAERDATAAAIKHAPRNWIAQPMLNLSTTPTLIDGVLAPRHVDLRPFVLQGERTACTTGGLCRVALTEGSLVVNSSQGGGSKDMWVIEDERGAN